MTRLRFSGLIILLTALCPLMAMGQHNLQGALSGAIGPGTYNVVGACTIDPGATLTIQPGTIIQFAGQYNWKVYGTLHANGTAGDSIVFKRLQPSFEYEWGGLRFMAGASTSCNLTHCYIEGARYQVWPDYNGGALYIANGGIAVSWCMIANNLSSTGGGIYIDASPATIDHCLIFNNTAGNGGGIYVYNSQNVIVSNSIFAKNTSTST